jgi:hypothetical protein
MPEDQKERIDLELRIFNELERLHERFAEVATKFDTLLRNVEARNDDILAVKQRQNRHGRKVANLDARVTVLETSRQAVNPPAMKEWDPEDTSPHLLTTHDVARAKEMVERDRADSEFYRRLPRNVAIRVAVITTTALVASLVTWFFANH